MLELDQKFDSTADLITHMKSVIMDAVEKGSGDQKSSLESLMMKFWTQVHRLGLDKHSLRIYTGHSDALNSKARSDYRPVRKGSEGLLDAYTAQKLALERELEQEMIKNAYLEAEVKKLAQAS